MLSVGLQLSSNIEDWFKNLEMACPPQNINGNILEPLLDKTGWLDHISCTWARGVDSFLTVVHGVLPIALLQGGSVSRFWFCTYSKCIWMPFVWSTAHCWLLVPSLIATWGDALDFQTRPTGFFFVLYKSSILEICCLRASGLHTTSDHWAMFLKLFHLFW